MTRAIPAIIFILCIGLIVLIYIGLIVLIAGR
jgi:hypothetical protein